MDEIMLNFFSARNPVIMQLMDCSTVGLFIIPQGQNNISEPKSKSYKIVIIFMIKGPKQFDMIQIYLNKDFYSKINIKFSKKNLKFFLENFILGFLGHLPDFETKITFFPKES